MTELEHTATATLFDQIRHVSDDGADEWWSARELMPLLGYDSWRRFDDAVERAQVAARNSGHDPDQHFAGAVKVPASGPMAADWHLTRYAAYLVAMNGDPRKPEIAAAQTYFAVRTRAAEVARAAVAPQIPQTYAEALRAYADEVEARELAENKVAELEPAAEQFRRWQTSPDTVYVVEWAKTIGLTQAEAFEALRECDVLFKQQHEGAAFNVPKRAYEQYIELVDEFLPGPRRWTKVPKITAEGQVVLAELLLEKGWIAP